ncbi:MAG: TIGR02757 family protein [Synergistaceae bacterium]|nr:TIGR02757 family protein [Synergistaceae bacterium]
MKPLEEAAARAASREIFEKIYDDYNRRIYVSPDPLQFLYDYEDTVDREVAGIIASGLAYGRVAQILKSVKKVLDALGQHPAEHLKESSLDDHRAALCGFVHRFTDCDEMCLFLAAVGEALRSHGSLEALFLSGYDGDMREGMENFAAAICRCAGRDRLYLLPRPSKGSACKRMALFLRWMVRCDEVDPGGWRNISPADLQIPLDTHMFNISSTLGLCSSKSANGKAAAEITENFKDISPDDPVKYDFALTRYGIREEMTVEELFAKWRTER